jgi:hypothetical protein
MIQFENNQDLHLQVNAPSTTLSSFKRLFNVVNFLTSYS